MGSTRGRADSSHQETIESVGGLGHIGKHVEVRHLQERSLALNDEPLAGEMI